MNIPIRLSAGLAYATGQTRLTLSLPQGATVTDAVAALTTDHPALSGRLQRALPMIDGRHVEAATELEGGKELLLLLPAAGGKIGSRPSDITTK
ncbi:MAG: MoaD/ThiS family protein [Caldilineaceae bacterium]